MLFTISNNIHNSFFMCNIYFIFVFIARNFIYLFIFPFIFIHWRLITLQYCSVFFHTLTWISHGFTCVPHPHPCSSLPLHSIPLGLPSAPALSTDLMHPTWAGDLQNEFLTIRVIRCLGNHLSYSQRGEHSVLSLNKQLSSLHFQK